MDTIRDFYGPNAGYVAELYEKFRKNPLTVDEEWRRIFRTWSPAILEQPKLSGAIQSGPDSDWQTTLAVFKYAQNIRQFGHLVAHLDPLGLAQSESPDLRKESFGLTEDILNRLPAELIGGAVASKAANAFEAIELLRRIYTSTAGYDFEHVHNAEERIWLRDSIEGRRFAPPEYIIDEAFLLRRLIETEALEVFLQRSFPGKSRFSVEGVDMLVPMLDELVSLETRAGITKIFIGMAHRGRLNVLTHILQVPYGAIFAEFKDPARHRNSRTDLDWTGDVKYHRGAVKIHKDSSPKEVEIFLSPNPSHLEAIDPVVEGMARAAGTDGSRPGRAVFDPSFTLPILIHGDASFPGQGIVPETLNLSRLEGYSAGGTIHIITNNQLGYTASPKETRSTRYASDLAKGFEIPIVHVNADAPLSCIEAIRLSCTYREKFHKDFLIDLVGYRRHGHNEGDEPTFTQPLMYEQISKTPTVRQKWAKVMQDAGKIKEGEADDFFAAEIDKLQNILASLEPDKALIEPRPVPPPSGAAKRVETKMPLSDLSRLNQALTAFPDNFSVHPKLARSLDRRRHVFDDPDAANLDWAAAESLALASLLEDGIPIRFSGQDSSRGTFSHRHFTYHDIKDGKKFTPLQALPTAKASFEIYNSPLTESADIGFEYGYNIEEPERLVFWEAQYGDFVNNAQTMVDEFITSARAKWGQTPSLVLLLPHAYEGQGPDHSSGRLERFLELAAETNMRISNCTSAAQYFHLLRRQALLLKTDPLPLIVMTPKGLLRHPRTASKPRDLFEGKWQPVLDDPNADLLASAAERVILCSGKIFVDLIDSPHRQTSKNTAIVRLEQLYPFPQNELHAILKKYKKSRELVWVQEEPENLGAWNFVRPLLGNVAGPSLSLSHISRPANASPAEGSTALHAAQQGELVRQAFAKSNDVELKKEGVVTGHAKTPQPVH